MGWQSLGYEIISASWPVTLPKDFSQAVLNQLATHTLALAFFATHYGSLTDDYAYHPNIRNMHMKTLVDDEKREVRVSAHTLRGSSF